MNKKLYSLILAVLALTGLMSSCSSKEEIVFDHERQQFETRADRILLEYIAPFGTTTGEEIYITGAFNNWDTSGAEEWKCIKAVASDVKWGIYLDPSTFLPGTSLGDGFRFYSKAQGQEVTLTGAYAIHNDDPALGTSTNIWGQRWEAYYWEGGEAPEPEHDGFCIYVDDQTGWDDLALYAWGDGEIFGGWPGASVKGTWKHEGVVWKYFDFGEANTGLLEHLIFNNAGQGSQLPDFDFTIDRNIYVKITPEGVEEVQMGDDVYEPYLDSENEISVFFATETEGSYYVWVWGDLGGGEAYTQSGAWPGDEMYLQGTYNGKFIYKYVITKVDSAPSNLIITLQVDGQEAARLYDGVAFENHGLYTEGSDTPEIVTKVGQGGGSKIQHDGYVLYIINQSSETDLTLYAWGDGLSDSGDLFGSWPGMPATGTETINGVEYVYFDLGEARTGLEVNLIPNNNGQGVQWEGSELKQVIDHDIYVRIADGDKTAFEVVDKNYKP